MSNLRFSLCAVLAAFILATGCATSAPNPLAGWKPVFSPPPIDQAIEKDYRDYIQALPPRKREFVGSVDFFQDGMGQHAVDIKLGVNGTWRDHVFIYDKENKRTKVIIYSSGHYRS